MAYPIANAVLLAADTSLDELLRHELAHLFAARWNLWAPPLLQEGLAVWWQRAREGRPVECLAEPGPAGRSLVRTFQQEWKPFDRTPTAQARTDACYLLAGYFTDFLIHRFGWERYEQLYRRASVRKFASQFRRVLGVSVADAEKQCRCYRFAKELLARSMERL
jgi:hypothetical protein